MFHDTFKMNCLGIGNLKKLNVNVVMFYYIACFTYCISIFKR